MNAPMVPATPANDQAWIESAEKQRDLRNQLAGIGAEDEQEIQFIEWSPGRRMVTVWNMESGESVTLPRYQAVAALNTVNPSGGYMWTADPSKAPEPFVPSVPCFLHPDSEYRPILRELGITATCMTKLSDLDSMEKHAKRHPSRWARLEREIARRERTKYETMQQQQTDAMMALAGGKAAELATAPEDLPCDECDFVAKNQFGLSAHKRGKHGG